jgi:hypothetical protein
MKITLNQIEIKAAIALYVREKCISDNCHGWEIAEIYLTEDNDAIVTVNAIERVSVAPAPCAPACPPRPY